jgi:membrane protein DedA with SNARE-associated domain
MQSYAFAFLAQHNLAGYMLAPIGTVLEGDGILFVAGYLAHQNIYNVWILFLSIWLGTTVGDLAWYELGRFLDGKNGRVVRWLKKATDPLGPHLKSRTFHTLFLSKFIYGINHASVAKMGSMRIPVHRVLAYNLAATGAWVVLVGGLGFLGSASFTSMRHYVHYTELGLLLTLLLFLSAERLVSFLFRKKI